MAIWLVRWVARDDQSRPTSQAVSSPPALLLQPAPIASAPITSPTPEVDHLDARDNASISSEQLPQVLVAGIQGEICPTSTIPQRIDVSLPLEATNGGIAGGDDSIAMRGMLDLGFHRAVERFKRLLLAEAIAACGGNRAEAARRLGLQRTYLYRLTRQLNAGSETAGEGVEET